LEFKVKNYWLRQNRHRHILQDAMVVYCFMGYIAFHRMTPEQVSWMIYQQAVNQEKLRKESQDGQRPEEVQEEEGS
jgi:hypothetical protein